MVEGPNTCSDSSSSMFAGVLNDEAEGDTFVITEYLTGLYFPGLFLHSNGI